MATLKESYLKAGLKLMPSGRINGYQMEKLRGRLGSKKDSTWVKGEKRPGSQAEVGYHTCCGSKRSYYHKVGCPNIKTSDDLSDLK